MSLSHSGLGSGVEEFLRYYVPSILDERPATVDDLRHILEERSAENERFRAGGSLLVRRSELEGLLARLGQEGLLVVGDDGSLSLTERGQRLMVRVKRMKDSLSNSKEDATTKLISILLEDFARHPRRKRVLDVGTGEGYLAFKLADAGFDVLGIDSSEFDYSKDSIRRAREKAEGRRNLEFRLCDVRSLGRTRRFDYVVSSQAVHCMKDQEASICSMCRALRGGGLFLVSDFLVGLRAFLVHGFHCFLGLTEEEWRDVLPRCGCTDVRIHALNDFCVVEARRPA